MKTVLSVLGSELARLEFRRIVLQKEETELIKLRYKKHIELEACRNELSVVKKNIALRIYLGMI